MPTPAIAAARACVFARDFTSLDRLWVPDPTYRLDEDGMRAEEVQAIDVEPYRIWNNLHVLHLTAEFGFLADLQAAVSAQQLASTDYQTDYDGLHAGRYWETLDTDVELLSNCLKPLIYVPHAGDRRIIGMTGFRCPLLLAPTPGLDNNNDTLSPDEIAPLLSRLCIPEVLHSQYKVVTSHHLDANNADETANLVMKLHYLSGGLTWDEYGDLANVPPGHPSLQEWFPECHPNEVPKIHLAFLEAGYSHWLHLQTREVCRDPEENEWDGSLLDILLIRNVEKGRRVLGAIVIQNRTG
ncbi:hypothetical protein HDU89_008580 [Geranomyces variabilis]|nr:hypothetical protein HDU89_008580 [Geranomyces variabilis]